MTVDQPDEDAARAAALNGPMMRFRAGEITARQADSEWEAADVLPYAKTLPGGVPTLAWSLTLAVAWIATRHLDLISAVALRSQHWQEVVANEPAEDRWTMDLAMARFQLEAALCRGQIEARGKRCGPFAQRDAVPSLDWQDLAIGFADGSVALDRRLRNLAPALWHEVSVRPEDLMCLWPGSNPQPASPSCATSPAVADERQLGDSGSPAIDTVPIEVSSGPGSIPEPVTPSCSISPAAARPGRDVVAPVAMSRTDAVPPSPEPISSSSKVAPTPTTRAARKAARMSAIERAKVLMANAPKDMLLPELRCYIKEREPSLSRADIEGIKGLYPHLRRPGENARTRAFQKSNK